VDAPPPQPGVDVEEIRAVVRLDPEAMTVEARATLVVRHPDTLAALALGLDDALDVRAVGVDGQAVRYRHRADALLVPVVGGRSEVTVVYGGAPAAGLYADTWAGQRVVYTDGWPDRTAGWLPAVHHPSDPARLDLTLDVPAPLETAASGRRVADAVAGGRRRTRFVLDDDAPVYTFAFAAADFDVIEDAGGSVPVRHLVLEGAGARAPRRTAAALDTLAALFGPYPYAGYTTVQVPMQYAGMENAAAPFLRADLYDGAAADEVDLHELVHQWWGNAVVPARWRDLWLSEGPATYLTADLLGRLDGPDAGRRHLVLMARQIGPADAARALVPGPLDDPADALTPTVYFKGGAVFHLLRLALGDGVFWPALRQIQADYADRPLSTAAFQRELERASGRSLDALFDTWVWGEGVPTLRTEWDEAARTLSWRVENDRGTLRGVPFELYVRQGATERFVSASAGSVRLPGAAEPAVEPVGILLEVGE
jgi:aminopeptidase N